MEESFKDTNAHHFVSPDDVPAPVDTNNVQEIRKLSWLTITKVSVEFKLTDSIKNKIQEAQKSHIKANSDLQFATLEYKGMNRDTIKKTKLSPDSMMQLAIQVKIPYIFLKYVLDGILWSL